MTEEWILTQNGAVRKSDVSLIASQNVSQNEGDNRKNIVFITRDKLAMSVYENIKDAYTATVIIDNLIKIFDETHIPQIDLSKKQEKEKVEESPVKKEDDAE